MPGVQLPVQEPKTPGDAGRADTVTLSYARHLQWHHYSEPPAFSGVPSTATAITGVLFTTPGPSQQLIRLRAEPNAARFAYSYCTTSKLDLPRQHRPNHGL